MIQVCIDESGDTGYSKKSSSYFVMCAVMIDDRNILRRIAKDVYRRKNKKKGRGMLHAYAENAITKNKLIKKLVPVEMSCFACVIRKEKVKTTDLYLYASKKIAKYLENKNIQLVVIAKRDTRKSYNQRIMEVYGSQGLRVLFSDPMEDKSLQIADFFSWAVYSKYEKGRGEYFEKLSKIIEILP